MEIFVANVQVKTISEIPPFYRTKYPVFRFKCPLECNQRAALIMTGESEMNPYTTSAKAYSSEVFKVRERFFINV